MRYFDPKALQRALKAAGCDPGPEDGVLGLKTAAAIRKFRAERGKDNTATIDPWLLDALGLSEAAPRITLSTLIGLVGPIFSLAKGRPMTTDQIGGLVRAILTFLAGLAVARGWVDNETVMTIVGAVVTVVTALWSMHTNRAEKLAPK